MARAGKPMPARVVPAFTVVVDTREKLEYTFDNIYANSDRGGGLLRIPVIREALDVGDYAVLGYPRCVVERKSKADLYASVVRRANFEGRLRRMSERCDVAFVVVEAEFTELLMNPPAFTKFRPKSLARTIYAWQVRYSNVHWWFVPGREFGEVLTYRLLERYWDCACRGLLTAKP